MVFAIIEISRKKPILVNRVDPSIEKAVVDLAIDQPTWGNLEYLTSLKSKESLSLPEA